MIRTPLLLAAVTSVAMLGASCSKDSGASNNKSDPSQKTTADPGKDTPAAPSGDLAARLTRVEKRLDKVTQVLEKALGPAEADPNKVYSVPIDPRDPVEGPADAKVTVVEGFEFACPYCYKASPIVEQLQAAFPNDVRLVNKYMVVHQPAIPAGLASCAANKQGKFPEFKKTMWTKAWGADGKPILEQLSPDALEKDAADLGMDVAKFKTDMNSEECRDWLEKSEQTLHDVGQSGTPGFYINGRPLGGLVPLDTMKQLVTDELAKAQKAIDGGVKQSDYYQSEIVGKGLKKVAGWFDVDDDDTSAATPTPAPAPAQVAQ